MENKYFTFIGPIAAGKGTQAEILCKKYGMYHLSTGQIFRDAMAEETEMGLKVKNIMDNGFLVPDAITNEVVKEKLSSIDLSKGFILDGYPRTINQVYALQDTLSYFNISLSKAALITIAEEETIRRISGRFSCAKCGYNYHDEFNLPKVEGVCDNCGSHEFKRRSDDKPEIVKTRLKQYFSEVQPIIDFYKEKKLLVELEATNLSVEDVTKELEKLLF
ncbi:MAG: nucleoside monophosphate kinase [Alphaproteobacteria bacterium]|nr:nucleoside monophosphate kinase [Alphaproteobacteria bacterium]